MSIQIGDINIANEIIELHFQLRKTQVLLEIVLQKIPAIGGAALSQSEIDRAEDNALNFVQSKFPNMGIKKKI